MTNLELLALLLSGFDVQITIFPKFSESGNLVIRILPFLAISSNLSPLFPMLVEVAISLAKSTGESSILKFTKTK